VGGELARRVGGKLHVVVLGKGIERVAEVVVPSAGQYRDVGRRVLVAWNSSREAARALNDAIPLMRNAETVVVVAFQRAAGAKAVPLPHLDVVAHLARHGINAQYERRDESEFAKEEEIGVVDALLNRGFELQADLTVIGGCRQ
jgi:nucleotide-binding universal stress UspA family protein